MGSVLSFALAIGLMSPLAAAAQTVVSLNFDDNTATHRIALRVLNERGLKASFYINTGYIGTSGFYLNRTDLNAIAAAGHEIAGHTLTHQILTNLSSAETQRQICVDRQTLVGWGFNPVSFAYPNGNYNGAVISAVRGCGYSNARTVGGVGPRGETLPPANLFAIRSAPLVVTGTTLAQLQKFVTDAEDSGGGLVPLVFHRVCNGCGTDTITEANLTAFLDWVRARESRGTVVRTMAQALGSAPPPPAAAPSITSLSPSSATAGGAAFTLRVDGTAFTQGSTVRWNGSNRSSIIVSETRIDAAIPAADIASAGTAAVTVANSAGVSNTRSFTINPPPAPGGNPIPNIATLSPASWPSGGSAFNLTVDGTQFVAGASVRWNGAVRTGVLQGTTRLIVYISANDVAAPATAAVAVVNPAPGGGTSNTLPFTVTGSTAGGGTNPVPTVSSLSPGSRAAGASAFNLTVDGTGFASGAVVRWNGLNRPGILQGSSRLIVYIPASDVASPGTASVGVFSPAPGGGLSNTLPFTITSSPSAIQPSADESFSLHEHYAFPNPSRRGQLVTIRVKSGPADSMDIRIYDIAGRIVRSGIAEAAQIVDGMYTQDFLWSVSGAGTGIYLYTVTVKKQGHADIHKSGKFGVIK